MSAKRTYFLRILRQFTTGAIFVRPSINVFVTRALFCLNVLGKLFNHIQEIRELPTYVDKKDLSAKLLLVVHISACLVTKRAKKFASINS